MRKMRFQDGKGHDSIFGKAIGLAGIFLVMLLLWLAADPAAHEHFHQDAGKGDHHCVVTDFAGGSTFYVVPPAAVRPTEAAFGAAHFGSNGIVRDKADYALLPICGPPSAGTIA